MPEQSGYFTVPVEGPNGQETTAPPILVLDQTESHALDVAKVSFFPPPPTLLPPQPPQPPREIMGEKIGGDVYEAKTWPPVRAIQTVTFSTASSNSGKIINIKTQPDYLQIQSFRSRFRLNSTISER